MTQTFSQQPGNRSIPEPREGYEQRKVVHRKYNDAIAKGWCKRTDVVWTDREFVLCERKVVINELESMVFMITNAAEEFITNPESHPEILAAGIQSSEFVEVLKEPNDTIEIASPTKKKRAK